jgi:adenylate kinase family enzyme
MKKIMIIGCGGAGKTQLALKLSQRLGIPLHHLDRLYWKTNWMGTEHEEFCRLQKNILATEQWIIDGNYNSTMNLRLQQADTIIYLDLPTLACLWGAISRFLEYRNTTRPDMTAGNDERLSVEFLKYILTFRTLRRPGLLQKLAPLKPTQQVFILNNRKQVEVFLNTCQSQISS